MLVDIQALEQELVEFTQEIIKIRSYTGEERELAEILLKKLQAFGIKESIVDGIGNVIGIIRGNVPGNTVMLNAHLDVVPAGDISNWNGYDPFGAEIDANGNIHGRGAADLKGGLSVQLFTMRLLQKLKEKGQNISGNLVFSAVVHEEAAEMFGMEYLCRKTLPEKNLKCDIVFLCEPTGLNIVLGQRGKVELVVKTKGRAVHSSTPDTGVNALEKMIPIMDHIFNKGSLTSTKHNLLGHGGATITNIVCRPGALSIIPDECEISIDRRYLPDQTVDQLLHEFELLFEKQMQKDAQFQAIVSTRRLIERSYTGYKKEVQKYHPPWTTDENHPLVKQSIQALNKIGQAPQSTYWQFGTDGSMTAGLLGIPTIGYSGTEECYAHTSEEIVNIDMMMKSLEGYYVITTELLGLKISF